MCIIARDPYSFKSDYFMWSWYTSWFWRKLMWFMTHAVQPHHLGMGSSSFWWNPEVGWHLLSLLFPSGATTTRSSLQGHSCLLNLHRDSHRETVSQYPILLPPPMGLCHLVCFWVNQCPVGKFTHFPFLSRRSWRSTSRRLYNMATFVTQQNHHKIQLTSSYSQQLWNIW